ncbi:hypothetical protein EC973_009660 [Apophysomyces ossiformis]|uniref:Uncharacterized protein n=1 Tax=Apophysomyces ossiformis TaxID=679940 RepID=A0A8H7BNQ4_9FUNG|nr:hypothetical protein EC973_009660 [Apophysomyces ossiformis]
MAYQRSYEAPMEFEYDNPPLFSYDAFTCSSPVTDSRHSYAEETNTSLFSRNSKQSKPLYNNLYIPRSFLCTKDRNDPTYNQVSARLGEISLHEVSESDEPANDQAEQEGDKQEECTDEESSRLVLYQPSVTAPSPQLEREPESQPLSPTSDSPLLSTPVASPVHPSTDKISYPHIDQTPSYNILYICSGLLQIGCNIALFTMTVYISVQFAIALKHDVVAKLRSYESGKQGLKLHMVEHEDIVTIELLARYYDVQEKYLENRCDMPTPLPAMVEQCREWEKYPFLIFYFVGKK